MNSKIHKFKLSQLDDFNWAIKIAAEVIRDGGVVIHPTDTCYGVAANIFNTQALDKVYLLKKRDYEKPLKIIVKDFVEFKKYGRYYPVIKKIMDKYSPYQISFIVPKTKRVPKCLNPGEKTVGIQIPRFSFCQVLLEEVGIPLVATSANISTQKECYNLVELTKQFKKNNNSQLDYLILYAGKLKRNRPSSVIRVINNEKIEVVRYGDAGQISI